MFAASKTASVSGGYQISRSLRFNSADTPNLQRTPSSNGNQRTATFSAWVKRSRLGSAADNRIFTDTTGSGPGIFWVFFGTSDQLQVYVNGTGTGITSTQVFRDPSAWYHVVVAVDTTQATASDRIKMYVNNVQITAFTGTQTYYSLNETLKFNVTTSTNVIGYTNSQTFDGYMTEVNWIDGSQLTPSSFGETNAQTGVWQPKAYSGTYGTNGFYLNFSDNSNTTAATLGKDYSGNGNNWTPNNFSVTAGAGNDSLVDSPTSYGTDTGVGGTVRGNYSTLNPLFNATTLTNGNLDTSLSSASVTGTFGSSTGKWYFECTITAASGNAYLGIADQTLFKSDSSFSYSQTYIYQSNGYKGGNGGSDIYGSSYTTGDVIGVAYDLDAGSITFYKNGTSQGVAYSTGFTAGYIWRPFLYFGSGSATFNFGQRPFAYTAPSGYKALCTQNLPTPTIGATSTTLATKYFNPVLWTGNGASSRAITGVGFQPDWVWDKMRSGAYQHAIVDSVRGGNQVLHSNSTSSEDTNWQYGYVSSFDSDGFTIQAGSTSSENWNLNGSTFVAWCWKANGSGSTNTAGTITSTVSANTTSGFSVVTYSGNSTQPSTVGHGLGVAPSFIIVKPRNSSTYDWNCYHISLGNTKYIALNTTAAASTAVSLWDNTTPTSTVFTVNHVAVNTSGNTYVAYCFAPIAGYSAFGSYTGNSSSDGPFLYLGFTPAYILIKQTNGAGTDWRIITINTSYLSANTSAAQYDSPPGPIRGVSNGVKIVGTGNDINGNTNTYIYAAFASYPFKYALAQPQ